MSDEPGLIDVNVFLSRWPFRRLPHDETPRLADRLRRAGVTQAWAGSFDALLHRDVAGVNARLAAECRAHGDLLRPFGAVNPTLPDWPDDLRRCAEEYGMAGIRLHPNYHGYGLDDLRFAELLDRTGELGLIVQIAVAMEDERTQHPLVRVPPVDLAPLPGLLETRPGLRVVLLNALKDLRGERLAELAKLDGVRFEIAMLEGTAGLERTLALVPHDRLLFGSLFPLFYVDAALLKLRESDLGHVVERAIRHGNAAALIRRPDLVESGAGSAPTR